MQVVEEVQATTLEVHKLLLATGLGDYKNDVRTVVVPSENDPVRILSTETNGHTRRVKIRPTVSLFLSLRNVFALSEVMILPANVITDVGEIGPDTEIFAYQNSGSSTSVQVWEAA